MIKKFIKNRQNISPIIKNDTQEINEIAQTLSPYLKIKINTKVNKNGGGTLNILFNSLEELVKIIKKIKNES